MEGVGLSLGLNSSQAFELRRRHRLGEQCLGFGMSRSNMWLEVEIQESLFLGDLEDVVRGLVKNDALPF